MQLKRDFGVSVGVALQGLLNLLSFGNVEGDAWVPLASPSRTRPDPASTATDTSRADQRQYIPPHLRAQPGLSITAGHHTGVANSRSNMDHANYSMQSSDSDSSDTEGGAWGSGAVDRYKSSRVRLTALHCVQLLTKADPKLLHAFWTVLLPTADPSAVHRRDLAMAACLEVIQ